MDSKIDVEELEKKNKLLEKNNRKLNSYFILFDTWMWGLQNGKSIGDYMLKMEYKHVAIYGMKELGERLYGEFINSGITVDYIIDNGYVLGDFKVLRTTDELPSVDIIIVTPYLEFAKIKASLEKKVDCEIIPINGLIGRAFGVYV